MQKMTVAFFNDSKNPWLLKYMLCVFSYTPADLPSSVFEQLEVEIQHKRIRPPPLRPPPKKWSTLIDWGWGGGGMGEWGGGRKM